MINWIDDAAVIVLLTLAMLWFVVLPCVGLYHVVYG